MINEWLDLWLRELLEDSASDHNETFLGSWDATLNKDVILLSAGLDDGDVEKGGLFITPVSAHSLAWNDAVVVTAVVSKGTDLAVIAGTVTLWTDVSAVSLDDATVTVTFGCADDVNDFTSLEEIGGEVLTNVLSVDFLTL